MATINYRLQKISEDLFIKYKSKEREYIEQRVVNFKNSIKDYFGNTVNEILPFGSYKRDTILPRKYDDHSDIDVLIIFNQGENEFTPETYRNHLKKFATIKYFSTKILKDHPSVVLEMSNIKFDLVPCRVKKSFWWGDSYQIPNKNGSWMDTDPKGFTTKLTETNNKYGSIVKPIIRLLKRWNAYSGYPYLSYELEKIIAEMRFNNDNYQTGFLYCIDKLPTYDLAEYQARKVNTLKNNMVKIESHLERDDQEKAEEIVFKILGLEY